MTAYTKSIELGLTGTDEDIVAILQTLADGVAWDDRLTATYE